MVTDDTSGATRCRKSSAMRCNRMFSRGRAAFQYRRPASPRGKNVKRCW